MLISPFKVIISRYRDIVNNIICNFVQFISLIYKNRYRECVNNHSLYRLTILDAISVKTSVLMSTSVECVISSKPKSLICFYFMMYILSQFSRNCKAFVQFEFTQTTFLRLVLILVSLLYHRRSILYHQCLLWYL